jgi:type I restriction enzyme S subunit
MASKGDIRKEEIQPAFHKSWATLPFKEGLQKPISFTKLKSKDYLETGSYPVVDQGEKFISGYVDDIALTYRGDLPIILFGDHTRVVKYIDFVFAPGADGTKILKPLTSIDDRFFYFYLKALKIPSFGYSRHYKVFDSLEIPLPPLPEQKRIVAKLDALFEHLDTIKIKLNHIPELLKNFRQQVLTQAVTGKLTEKWREGKELEDSSRLFEYLKKRRSSHSNKKVRELKINLRTDLPLYNLPETWNWCDLDYLMDEYDNFCYGVVQPGNNVPEGQKLIRVMDLQNGKILTNQLRSISWSIDKNYSRSKVNKGNLLVSVVGTIGRTAIVDENSKGFNIARAIAKVPIKDINVRYLQIFLNSTFGQRWLIGDAREVARKTLNLNQLSTLPIPIPPIPDQNEIVKKVDRLFTLADKIETEFQSLKERIDNLPLAILYKAFKGELVPQDPNDEPAKVLLERNKAMKGGQG